ncbi:hypothetical protein SH449x_000721 [Pirellulaceae bacterium SH449]
MLTQEQKSTAMAGACFALRFLAEPENRENARVQMAGFSDAAIFHRWMTLSWTLREPEAIAFLDSHQLSLLEEFNTVFDSIPWVPIETSPFISDTSDAELRRLVPVAVALLRSLESQ